MVGVKVEDYMKKQKEQIEFLNVPWAVRLLTDAMIKKGFFPWKFRL